ncbi:MAG TPA: TIGR00266 family protein [Bacteroidia bacterium]|nr:TIGR00266 family protein [Bacteroidia bacterium]HNS11208.1 TIGR00266 family protein [Bacteroidia bacterium]
MAHEIEYKIFGDDMQSVEIELDPNEAVRAEVGAMLYMEEGIQMQTSSGGGIFQGLKRIVSGENFFITSFLNSGVSKSKVMFAAPYPGKIIPLDLRKLGGDFLCQRDGYLCSAEGIEISVEFTKRIGAGLFGGEGFILQRLKGDGLAFVHAGGTVIEKQLQHGESLRVDTGCLVAFQPSVNYDIQFVGGVRNVLFGGEGLFYAKLTGPGIVYLQTLPFSRLADRIISASRWGGGKEESRGIGGLFGSLLSGNK